MLGGDSNSVNREHVFSEQGAGIVTSVSRDCIIWIWGVWIWPNIGCVILWKCILWQPLRVYNSADSSLN